jgi:O-antigen/teichoic acid export membrane protein
MAAKPTTTGLSEALLEQTLPGSPEDGVIEPRPAPGAEVQSSMDHALLHAIAWTGGAKWATQVVTWTASIISARILSPSDYGLYGMATMYIGLVSLISEFGLGQSVITLRDLTRRHIAQINSISLILGAGLFAISAAAAPFIGRFFHAAHLSTVIWVMSLGFLVAGFQVVPDALLQRELQFKSIASFDVLRALLQGLGTVGLAWFGFGYWSLALGNLSGTVLYTGLVLMVRRHSFAWPNLRENKRALTFSGDILGSRVAWYSYSNSDFLVAGRVLGEASLGSYTMAWTMAATPVEKITNMVMKVAPAFFSAVRHDKVQLRRYLLGITEGLSLLCFPACVGLALVADQFVLAVLGAKWVLAITPLRLLALCAAMRSITTLLPVLLNTVERSRFVMLNTVVAAMIFPASFYLSSHWGTGGIAATWILIYPFITAPFLWKAARELDLSIWTYLKSILPALRACLVMSVAVVGVRILELPGWPILGKFSVSVLAGALSYGAFAFLFEKERMRKFYSLVKGARA